MLACPAAAADPVKLAPILDARLRWEQVEQDGIANRAEAVTARIRSGVTATTGPWQALVESEATLAIVPDYNTGSNGRTRYPVVRDPQNVEFNRAQLRYAAHGLTVTAGRQLLELADQRFVGSGSFRQNEQTFDAVRVQVGAPTHVFVDVTYAGAAHTPNGINGTGASRYTVAGDNVFAIAGARTPLGTAAAFAYLVDQDEVAVQGYRLSSQTYGARLAGTLRLSPQLLLAYTASAARQSDWHRNPNSYRADYRLIEGAGTYRALTLTAGQETLGADDGRALTSVQTPLAALFKFDGWADKFTTTPPDGLRDRYAAAALAWKKRGPLDALSLSAVYHDFDSDRLRRDYGQELDLLASARRGRTTYSLRYADYRARSFATDTRKLWIQFDWVL